jgi:hypothetical protein
MRVAGRPVDAELGGQLDLVATVGDAAADQDLVVAGPVEVRGVDERDAKVERAVDGRDRFIPVGGAVPLAHPHAAQALGRHGELAKFGGAHMSNSFDVRLFRAPPGSFRSS